MTRRALITGITGQDGSYLCELLLAKGYEVHGLVRRSSLSNTARIDHLISDPDLASRLHLHHGDMTDAGSLRRIVARAAPDEVYNLAAQSHVRLSFEEPEHTLDVTGAGVVRLLEALRDREHGGESRIRFYQAGSSEMFGATPPRQNESSRFHPRSPYACAKVFAHHQVVNYREAYGLFACNGILFNHESPRRGENFVTRKITRAAARIHLGLADRLTLGNLDTRRDWGYAVDYVDAMWRMLQADAPDDYVVCTGVSHSLRDLLALVFGSLGLDWRQHVGLDSAELRRSDVPHLEGDPSKARTRLDWTARTDLAALVELMLRADIELARRELGASGVVSLARAGPTSAQARTAEVAARTSVRKSSASGAAMRESPSGASVMRESPAGAAEVHGSLSLSAEPPNSA